jgi:putative glutamine amidotransferase
MPRKPVVAIAACVREINEVPFHSVHDKYVRAIAKVCDATPVIVPAFGDEATEELVDRFDGFVFPGSPSNVDPSHYDGPAAREGVKQDAHRDATTLPLLRALLEAEAPVLAICRGIQELNVACGGTLHQHVQELPGKLDHRAPPRELPVAVRYAPEHHHVDFTSDGLLRSLAGTDRVMVNSLHHQGIDRLGEGLAVEAVAPDGLIEAVRYMQAKRLVLGVQWHPEACIDFDAFSRAIFETFREALRR